MDTNYLSQGWFLVASNTIYVFAGAGTSYGLLWRMRTCLGSQQAGSIYEEQCFSKEEGDCTALQGSLFEIDFVHFVCR